MYAMRLLTDLNPLNQTWAEKTGQICCLMQISLFQFALIQSWDPHFKLQTANFLHVRKKKKSQSTYNTFITAKQTRGSAERQKLVSANNNSRQLLCQCWHAKVTHVAVGGVCKSRTLAIRCHLRQWDLRVKKMQNETTYLFPVIVWELDLFSREALK